MALVVPTQPEAARRSRRGQDTALAYAIRTPTFAVSLGMVAGQRVLIENWPAAKALEEAHNVVAEIYARHTKGSTAPLPSTRPREGERSAPPPAFLGSRARHPPGRPGARSPAPWTVGLNTDMTPPLG